MNYNQLRKKCTELGLTPCNGTLDALRLKIANYEDDNIKSVKDKPIIPQDTKGNLLLGEPEIDKLVLEKMTYDEIEWFSGENLYVARILDELFWSRKLLSDYQVNLPGNKAKELLGYIEGPFKGERLDYFARQGYTSLLERFWDEDKNMFQTYYSSTYNLGTHIAKIGAVFGHVDVVRLCVKNSNIDSKLIYDIAIESLRYNDNISIIEYVINTFGDISSGSKIALFALEHRRIKCIEFLVLRGFLAYESLIPLITVLHPFVWKRIVSSARDYDGSTFASGLSGLAKDAAKNDDLALIKKLEVLGADILTDEILYTALVGYNYGYRHTKFVFHYLLDKGAKSQQSDIKYLEYALDHDMEAEIDALLTHGSTVKGFSLDLIKTITWSFAYKNDYGVLDRLVSLGLTKRNIKSMLTEAKHNRAKDHPFVKRLESILANK